MTELKDCPFCGAKPETLTDGKRTWGLVMHRDGCLLPMWPKHEIPEYDFEAWNTRAERIYATGGIIAQVECRDVCASVSEFICSACGFNCDLMSWISLFDGDSGRHRHHHYGTPNYCPNCGAKVVER